MLGFYTAGQCWLDISVLKVIPWKVFLLKNIHTVRKIKKLKHWEVVIEEEGNCKFMNISFNPKTQHNAMGNSKHE